MRTQADHAEYDWHAGPSDDEVAAEMEADRCQQLAALEREIGRAYCSEYQLSQVFEELCDYLARYDVAVDEGDLDAMEIVGKTLKGAKLELRKHHARWRKLHAEDAEAEAASERQEGE